MITRKASGSHICLTCRYSLSKRPAALNQHRFVSQKPRTAKYLPSTKDELERHNYRSRSDRRSELARGSSTRDSQSFGGLYGHHGQGKRALFEDLNTQSLNTPAKAIVLRDTIFNYYTYDQVVIKPELAEHIDIEQQLNEERGLVGQEEINENITTCKPKPGHEPSSWDGINDLVQELSGGFTTVQLQKYIEVNEKQKAVDEDDVEWEESIKNSSIVNVTSWLPGISDVDYMFDSDSLRGYFLDSHTAKQRLALRLLRDCWHVELPELAEGIGQFEIEVASDDLDILLLGSPSAMEQICGQNLLLEQEKMEVFRSRNVIRTTTLQHKRKWITSRVREALNNISRTTIDLRVITPLASTAQSDHRALVYENISSPMLDELSRLTECQISRIDKNHIRVCYIKDVEDETESFASKIASVRRLLISSVNSARLETQVAQSILKGSKPTFIRCPPQISSSLPWYDRHRDWSRWTAPIGIHSSESKVVPIALLSAPTSESRASHASPAFIQGLPEEVENAERSKDPTWDPIYVTRTSALLGAILHEDNARKAGLSSDPRHCQSSLEKGHTFSTNVPCISSVLNREDIEPLHEGQPSIELVLRFLPNPFLVTKPSKTKSKSKNVLPTGSQALSALPPVEIRFGYNDRQKTTMLKDVSAIVQNFRTDVMLPDKLVDTRFEQLTHSRLQGDRPPKNVLQYIDSSKFSFANGIIDPASTIKFPITKHLIKDSGSDPSSFKNDNYEIEYLFAGLEIRTKLQHSWQGWLLEYTSIKAGRAVGSRSELRLHPIKDGVPVGEGEFIEAAYRLADVVGGDGNSAKIRKIVPSDNSLVRRTGSRLDDNIAYFAKRLDLSPIEEVESFAAYKAEAEILEAEPVVFEPEDDELASLSAASIRSRLAQQEAVEGDEKVGRKPLDTQAEEDGFASESSLAAEAQDLEPAAANESEVPRSEPVVSGAEEESSASDLSTGIELQDREEGATEEKAVTEHEEENKPS